jgi:hypothetical protein
MSGSLTSLTQLQSALTNQHKYNPANKIPEELKLISQGQELVYRALMAVMSRINTQAVDVSSDAASRAAAAAAENALRQAISAVLAERTARVAAFDAIPGYGEPGYGLSESDFTNALKLILESALQSVATEGGYWSGDGTADSPLEVEFPAPPVPEAPTADGRYVLEVSGGTASWASA